MKIGAISSPLSLPEASEPLGPRTAGRPNEPARDPALVRAAAQFESVFVRQLLEAAHLMGKDGGAAGYGSMAVDALASGIEAGGGIGLARAIEDALGELQRR